MSTTPGKLLLTFGVGLAVCSCGRPSSAPTEDVMSVSSAERTSLGQGTITPTHPLFMSASLARKATVSWSGKGFSLDSSEIDPVSLEKYQSSQWHSVSFEIVTIVARTANELYIAGSAPNGMDVIERWTITPVEGEFFADRAIAQTPIGTPAATAPTVVSASGGTFFPPASRAPQRQPSKSMIFTGADLGGIRSLAVDPDGRFVLVLAGSGPRRLYRIENEAGSSPVVLFDSSTDAFMAFADYIKVQEHATLGRAYFLDSLSGNAPGVFVTLLFDHDNDGIFDAWNSYTPESYAAAGFSGGVWTADYLNYFD